MVQNEIEERFGVPREKLVLIPNGVDLAHFHPDEARIRRPGTREKLGIPLAAPVVLFVGSGFVRKGLPQLLDAFAMLRRDDARLLVVGRDRASGMLQQKAQRLGLGDRVVFLGGVNDVLPLYGSADAFALPTLYDPFPNAALEALACGLPVVTSTTSGAADLIRQGENGYVADALDVAALAWGLDQALAADGAWDAAARRAAETMPIADTASQLLALYRRLAADRPL